MKTKQVILTTKCLIFLTFAVWIPWDFVAYHFAKDPGTESANIFVWGYFLPPFPAAMGALMGHFFGQFRPPSTKDSAKTAALSIAGLSILLADTVWLIFDLYKFEKYGRATMLSQAVCEITHHIAAIPFVLGFLLGVILYQMSGPTLAENK